jgi:hypothetical protein
MDLIDALRDEKLDLPAARALLTRAADAMPREAWLAIIQDELVPRPVRRLAIRRVLETHGRPGATLAELGALVVAAAWLEPPYVRHVSVLGGKLPVQWLAEDRVIAIDVLPAEPGDGDRHRLLAYLRVAGQPEVDEIVTGLRGGPGGEHEVRELGFTETDPPRPEPARGRRGPVLGTLVLCRRALCDAQTGMHTLVDVIVELPVRVPGPAMFDIYLQIRDIPGPSMLAIQVLGPALTDDGAADADGEVLTTGTLTLGARDPAAGPPPAALGIAIPNVTIGFEHAGEHRLRVRSDDAVLGELRFLVVDAGAADAGE